MTPRGRLSDDELAARAARGDDRAFGTLFERLQDPLYRYSLSILGHPEEARDALRNAMVEARATLHGSESEVAARPWLYRIARAESVALLGGREPLAGLHEAVAAAAGSGEAGAERERLDELVSGLRALPERQRSALVLRELSELDYDELGQALDISPNAARQTVFKARLALQGEDTGRTAHCDEVRAAISKDDDRFRKRRSIEAHLERCSVCSEFADQVESRPRDLAALFPPLPAGVAAAVLDEVTASAGERPGEIVDAEVADEDDERRGAAAAGAGGAALAGAAAAAAAGGGEGGDGGRGEGDAGGAGERGPVRERPARERGAARERARSRDREPRRRRGALVPLLLFLVLIAGALVTANLLDSGDDGDPGEPAGDVAQPPDDGSADEDGGGDGEGGSGGDGDEGSAGGGSAGHADAAERARAKEREEEEARAREREEARAKEREEAREREQAREREEARAREEREAARERERERDEARAREERDQARARERERDDGGSADEDCVERAGTRQRPAAARQERQATSPAQAGYSGRGGSVETTIGDRAPATQPAAAREDCVRTSGQAGTPRTGADLGLLAAAALVLLLTGLALRRLLVTSR